MRAAKPIDPRLFALLVAALFSSGIAVASPSADGWGKLWRNENVAARTAFRAAIKRNPSDLQALRGLGVLSLQEEADTAALQAWRPIYRLAPGHWTATAYWPRMVVMAYRTGRWGVLAEASRDILASRNAPPDLRASARLALAAIAFRSGKTAEAETHWTALGMVRQWRAIGPFDNVSRSGFEKRFPPEEEIAFDRTYPGKEGQALRWRRLPLVRREGTCAIAAALGDETPGVFYAVTALASPRDQAVALRFDPTGAGKIFLNGDLVFSDDTYREQKMLCADPFRVPVTLRKGWNTLLVKIAEDEERDASFALRVTSLAGDTVQRLVADPARATGATVEAQALPERTVETQTVSRLRAAGENLEAAVALSYHFQMSRDTPAAVAVLKRALTKAPSSAWLHWELSEALTLDEQPDEARAERDIARKLNPRLVPAEISFLGEKTDALPATQRIQRLKALLKVNPGAGSVLWGLASTYYSADLTAEALKTARAAAAATGGDDDLTLLLSYYQVNRRGREAEQTLTRALRAAPNAETLLAARARTLAAEGKTAAAIAVYERILQVEPAEWRHRQTLADLYRAARNLKAAERTLRLAREMRPQDGQLCALHADCLREIGQKRRAIELYRTAIRLAPADVSLREKLRLLTGARPVVDLAPATPVDPILASIKSAGKGRDDPRQRVPTNDQRSDSASPPSAEHRAPSTGAQRPSAIVLLDEAREVVYADYAQVSYARHIVQVLDAAAVERYQAFPLDVPTATADVTVESARIVKQDGKVQDVAEMAVGSMITLPSLAPGDVIDIAYRVEDYPRGGLARQFWTQWHFATPSTRVKLARYVLITPPEMMFEYRAHGGVPEPSVKDVKGWRVREWRMTDLQGPKLEAGAPGARDTGPWLDISTIRSWKQIVEWYRDLSQPRCVPDATIRARALELTRGAKTEEEKLRALIRFVSHEIQYQSTPFRMSAYVPTPGKQVLRERYGDCKDKAALLTALLATVGIRSHMVLLSGRREGTTPFLPSPRFSHAIARVQTASGPLWVDATADELEFGALPSEDQMVPALVIDDTTTELVTSPMLPAERSRFSETHQVELAADGGLSGQLELTASGDLAWLLRLGLRRVPEASHGEALRAMATALLADTRCESSSVEQLENPDEPLRLSFAYRADRYSSTAGNFLLVRLPWLSSSAATVDRLLAGGPRQQDVELGMSRGRLTGSVRLTLPDGYVPQDLQPEVAQESPWGVYRYRYRVEGNVLHAEREFTLTPLRVGASEFAKLAEFLRGAEEEARKQVVLRKS
jgi:tetratricopeptide (TPR) repeat protein